MKKYVVQTVAIYALALLICSFINIDKIAPWYRLEITSQDSPLLKGLNAVDTLAKESGVQSAVKKFDCSTAFLFNDTYKDNSDCFLSKGGVSEADTCSPEKMRKLRLMARVVYDQLRRERLSGAGRRITHADWTVPAGSPFRQSIRNVQFSEPQTSADVAVTTQKELAPAQTAQQDGDSDVKVEMGANKQLLQQQGVATACAGSCTDASKTRRARPFAHVDSGHWRFPGYRPGAFLRVRARTL